MTIEQFQVRKDNLTNHRLVYSATPKLEEGEILVRVERFGLTANNITYGVVGERIGYWHFFPPAENEDGGWGIIPVWGFADVIEARTPEVPVGERLYGYFPMATHLVMRPDKVSPGRLFDAAEHRAQLPPVYNSYVRLSDKPDYEPAMDDARVVLQPLYATSFCLHDFFSDNDWFGAEQLVVMSASSKTAIGLAYALADDADAPQSIAMTSQRNLDQVKALGLYDRVLAYDAFADVDCGKATAIVDMSGAGSVLSALHVHLGDSMRYCCNVGLTHWSKERTGPGFIRDRSAMFFAPGHIQKRAAEWGKGEFERRAFEFWRQAAKKSTWLHYEKSKDLSDAGPVFDALRDGKVAPQTGIVVAL
ncbi:MAG: DUF2855 family protein [Pseudomonadota bacterium]